MAKTGLKPQCSASESNLRLCSTLYLRKLGQLSGDLVKAFSQTHRKPESHALFLFLEEVGKRSYYIFVTILSTISRTSKTHKLRTIVFSITNFNILPFKVLIGYIIYCMYDSNSPTEFLWASISKSIQEGK